LVLVISATAANAGQAIESARPVKTEFIGNSLGWEVKVQHDYLGVTIKRVPRYATATDLILVTDDGLEAYDISKDGTSLRNDDRRILRDGETVEFAPARALVLEMPSKVEKVQWTRPLALQIQVVVDGRFIAAKYAPYSGLTLHGPRRMTVTTDAGSYTFDVAESNGGAPIYRVESHH